MGSGWAAIEQRSGRRLQGAHPPAHPSPTPSSHPRPTLSLTQKVGNLDVKLVAQHLLGQPIREGQGEPRHFGKVRLESRLVLV